MQTKPKGIRQARLLKRMSIFLNAMNESLPGWTNEGLCNAYVLTRIRALEIKPGDLKQDEINLKRKISLAKNSDDELHVMGVLLSRYKTRLTHYETELKEKLLKCKDKKEEDAIRRQHQEDIMKQVALRRGEYDPVFLDLIKEAEDLYNYIQMLLGTFRPDIYDYHIEEKEKKQTRPVTQRDFIEILHLFPPDEFIQYDEKEKKQIVTVPLRQALSFSFSFTEKELSKFLQDHIQEGDRICLRSTNHAMFLTKKGENYILDDPNSDVGEESFQSTDALAKAIKSDFFTKLGTETDCLLVSFDIYERTDKKGEERLTETQILQQLLINREENINAQSWDGATALFMAALQNQVELVKELLARGADPLISVKSGSTPLSVAAQNGNSELVRILIEAEERARSAKKGIQVEEKKTASPVKIHTSPICIACQQGHLDVVKELLKYQVYKQDLLQKSLSGETAIHYIAHQGRIDILEEVLKHIHPTDLFCATGNGITPLHAASENGHVQIIDRIMREKTKLKDIPSDVDQLGRFPLFIAAGSNQPQVIRLLVTKYKEDPNRTIKTGLSKGLTAGDIATSQKNIPAMRALLECGANFKFVKAEPKYELAIKTLLGIKNLDGLHVDVLKEIRGSRDKLTKKLIEYIKSIPSEAEQLRILQPIIDGPKASKEADSNVISIILNELPRPGFFSSKPKRVGERNVSECVYKLHSAFQDILKAKEERRARLT